MYLEQYLCLFFVQEKLEEILLLNEKRRVSGALLLLQQLLLLSSLHSILFYSIELLSLKSMRPIHVSFLSDMEYINRKQHWLSMFSVASFCLAKESSCFLLSWLNSDKKKERERKKWLSVSKEAKLGNITTSSSSSS